MGKKVKTKDDFDQIAEEKVSIGPGYFAIIRARRDKESKKISLSVWRPLGNKAKNQSLSFGKKAFMDEIIRKLRKIEEKIGWKLSDAEVAGIDFSNSADLKKSIETLREKLRKKDDLIKTFSEKLDQKEISQIREIKFEDAFKKAYTGFKEKIDLNKEPPIQKYISEHLWLISPEYYGQTQKRITGGGQFDFKVVKLGGFYDIVEIKKPNIDLFAGDLLNFATANPSKTPVLNSVVKKALFQLMEYLEREINATQLKLGGAFRQGNPESNEAVFKPKGTLVIGKFNSEVNKGKAERMLLRQFNSYLHGVEIITYTELLERSKLFADLKENNGVKE